MYVPALVLATNEPSLIVLNLVVPLPIDIEAMVFWSTG